METAMLVMTYPRLLGKVGGITVYGRDVLIAHEKE
jgi:hypothetical protein